MEGNLNKLFERIRVQRAREWGRRLREVGTKSEEVAFAAAEGLECEGRIQDWRRADPELEANGVDLEVTTLRGSQVLINIKASEGAVDMHREHHNGQLPDWIQFVILPPNTDLEEAKRVLMEGIELMEGRYRPQ